MITTQADLDLCLDRSHTINVEISVDGPLPFENKAYDTLRNLPQTGFTFTPRDLLHAIGCKTAALPASLTDECLRSALLYTIILDLESDHLSFQGTYGSDLQTARSHEVGIGIMCLLAERHFNIPWDQLGPLPGRGKRFDYRGTDGVLDCIFESKGTSHIGYQYRQINEGLVQKHAHHSRGESFDVELIISSFIGHNGGPPRILVADPDKSSFKELYKRGDARYYRLKHYCRALQFIGLPRSAYQLNAHARDYLSNKQSLYKTIIDEKQERGFLTTLTVNGDEFLGRWFDSWLPKESKRYMKLYEKLKRTDVPITSEKCRIFQGIRRDVYEYGLTEKPFSQPLLSRDETKKYGRYQQSGVSILTDGTIMVFRHCRK